MDSKELREMSIRNAKIALEQPKLWNQTGFWEDVAKRLNRTLSSESDELWDEVTKLTETKKYSVKKLNIVGIENSDWNKGGIVVEYIGRNLSYEEDNYMWEITDIVDTDNHKEFVLLRNSIEKESKRVWMWSVWKVDDSGMGNGKVLLKTGVITKAVLNHPATLIDFIIQNTINEYRASIQ